MPVHNHFNCGTEKHGVLYAFIRNTNATKTTSHLSLFLSLSHFLDSLSLIEFVLKYRSAPLSGSFLFYCKMVPTNIYNLRR